MKYPQISSSHVPRIVRITLLFVLLVNGFHAAPKTGASRYRTVYACEGNTLEIVCDEGTVINLIRANYGRYSISICNDHGNLEWKVDCTSHRSYYVIANSCRFKKQCHVLASSVIFEDPCPNTFKYLEVHYQCLKDSTRNSSNNKVIATGKSKSSKSSQSSASNASSNVNSNDRNAIQSTHRPTIIIPLTQLYKSRTLSTTTSRTPVNSSSVWTRLSPHKSMNEHSVNTRIESTSLSPSSSNTLTALVYSSSSSNSIGYTSPALAASSLAYTTASPALVTSSHRSYVVHSTQRSLTTTEPVTRVFVIASPVTSTTTTHSPTSTSSTTIDKVVTNSSSIWTRLSPQKSVNDQSGDIGIGTEIESTSLSPSNNTLPPLTVNSGTSINCISSVIAIIILCLAFISLLLSGVNCYRSSIYKNLCVSLLAVELLLACIALSTNTFENQKLVCTAIAAAFHYLLHPIFILLFIDSLRVYCCARQNCDQIKDLICRYKTIFYLITYGLPLFVVVAFSVFYENSIYRNPYSRYVCSINLNEQRNVSLFAFSLIYASILAAIVCIVCSAFSVRKEDVNNSSAVSAANDFSMQTVHKSRNERMNDSWQPTALLLISQIVNWTVCCLFLQQSSNSNSVVTSSLFAACNVAQALLVFLVSFAKNDKIGNNLQNTFSSLHWLPQCIKKSHASPATGVTPSSHTAFIYSIDTSQLATPPSPLIKLTKSSASLQRPHIETNFTHTLPSNVRYIPKVSPYAPPVPILSTLSHALSQSSSPEYEDISVHLSDCHNYGYNTQNSRHSASNLHSQHHYSQHQNPHHFLYRQNYPQNIYETRHIGLNTRSPIYYSEANSK